MTRWLGCLAFSVVLAGACTSSATTEPTITIDTQVQSTTTSGLGPPVLRGELSYEVVATYPHKTTSFTQGLEITTDGRLIESIGQPGESGRALVDLDTGEHLAFEPLDDELFGEGMTEVGDELFQLTWKEGVVLVSNSATLEESRRYRYGGEGWGLCFDGAQLVMSDGSDELTFRDPTDFTPTRTVRVTSDNEDLVGQLNELECVGSQVWANVYFEDHLIAIDSTTGEIQAWADLTDLVPDGLENLEVLNGIAYRPETETFLVTGKNWPKIFELRFS